MEAKLYKDNDTHYYVTVDGNIMASTDGHPLKAITNKLSLKNCQAIANGYDLDELAKEELLKAEKHHKLLSPITYRDGVIKGFRKALEILGDAKFNEEDMRKAYFQGDYDAMYEGAYSDKEKKYIQSLQQTEWDVEIEMEEAQEIYRSGVTKYIKVPKLDPDGCLTLKFK